MNLDDSRIDLANIDFAEYMIMILKGEGISDCIVNEYDYLQKYDTWEIK